MRGSRRLQYSKPVIYKHIELEYLRVPVLNLSTILLTNPRTAAEICDRLSGCVSASLNSADTVEYTNWSGSAQSSQDRLFAHSMKGMSRKMSRRTGIELDTRFLFMFTDSSAKPMLARMREAGWGLGEQHPRTTQAGKIP